jgi:hypothetical protein
VTGVASIAFAAAGLLLFASVTKLARPATSRAALAALHVPGGTATVRGLAVVEGALSCLALLRGTALLWSLVALSYAAFTVLVLVLRARGGALASCGCFGGVDTPATLLHAAITALFATTAAVATRRPPDALGMSAADAVVVAVSAVAVAYAAYAVMAVLPQVRGAHGRSS